MARKHVLIEDWSYQAWTGRISRSLVLRQLGAKSAKIDRKKHTADALQKITRVPWTEKWERQPVGLCACYTLQLNVDFKRIPIAALRSHSGGERRMHTR